MGLDRTHQHQQPKSERSPLNNRIAVFTVHKAASMFLHQIMCDLTGRTGMPYYSPNHNDSPDLNKRPFPVTRENNDPFYAKHFRNKKGCIGPVRRPVILDDFNDFNIIVHLRDPRDGLTSMFFSYAYSHGGIRASDRQEWIADGIDRFVIEQAADYFERYRLYCENFIGKPNVAFVTYEEMVGDFPSWLDKFIRPFPLVNKSAARKYLLTKYRNEFAAVAEDKMKHKRKITPGDHKEKLQPETIALLNRTHGDILAKLGYLS